MMYAITFYSRTCCNFSGRISGTSIFTNPLGNVVHGGFRSLLSTGDTATKTVQITQEMVAEFASLSGDINPLHVDPTAAQRAVFADIPAGSTIVHGALLNALVSSVVGTELPGPGTVVVGQRFRFPSFCFSTDCVRVQVTMLEVRKLLLAEYEVTVPARQVTVMRGTVQLVPPKVVVTS